MTDAQLIENAKKWLKQCDESNPEDLNLVELLEAAYPCKNTPLSPGQRVWLYKVAERKGRKFIYDLDKVFVKEGEDFKVKREKVKR